MDYEIAEKSGDVEILVTGVADRAPQVVAAMQECQEGRCGCPTDQYDRLAGMSVQAGHDEVMVSLRPHVGERLDVSELRACLDYTLDHAQGE